ncbi:MAG TPA: flagellar hook protein FlgE [Acidobacteriaceae bacterium]|jgi:flagellar hook protein FlgE|nr:flagellar hook protein FlgE [Acidobacteriaceae bacterium]
MGSFSTPLSGLTAAQSQLQSVSNNLANIDTDGFKDQNLTFSDVFSQTSTTNGSGDPVQTGSGVVVSSTDSNFTEGSLNATGTASNMALSGNGFFVTQSASGFPGYTRAGDFTTNKSGQIVTPSGDLVLGYPAVNGVVNTATALQPLQVGTGEVSPAVASTTINISANLNASSVPGDTASSTLQAYDSLGAAHTLTVTYTMTAPNTWTYAVTIPSADFSPAGTTPNTTVGSGTLNFSSGVLVSTEPAGGTATVPPSAGIALTIPPTGSTFADGAAALPINWNLETAGTPTITQTATASSTSATSTNGFASGTLQSYTVQSDGTIEGTFSSGQTLALGQVAVASFANVQGLADVGNNDFQSTAASGAAVVGLAGTGGRGTIVGGSVEQSNVNIATEFAKLIVAQQAYSANAKTITTFNQVSQATIAMLQ